VGSSPTFRTKGTIMLSCYKCAFKHLSQAQRVYGEICQGYAGDVEHLASLVGDLACASDHLLEKQPDLAGVIRGDRILLLDFFAARPGEIPTYRPDFKTYLRLVIDLMVEDERIRLEELRKGIGG
jgi:hypothetical protein